MVTVACRLKHGLIVEHPAMSGRVIELSPGLNDGVPAEFAEWARVNAALPCLRRRDVFVVPANLADRIARDTGP